MTPNARERGFTLIELMIVVAIIGILAAVAIPKFAEMLRKSKEGASKGSLTNLRSTLTIYISDNEGMTPLTHTPAASATAATLISVIVPKYVEAIPTAKIGTYHADSSSILRISEYDSTNNRSADIVAYGDSNGWVYTSTSGGGWWVGCSHTDTKNLNISAW